MGNMSGKKKQSPFEGVEKLIPSRRAFLLLLMGPGFDVRPMDDADRRVHVLEDDECPVADVDFDAGTAEVLLVVTGAGGGEMPLSAFPEALGFASARMLPAFRARGWSIEPLPEFVARGHLAWLATIHKEGFDLADELKWVAGQEKMVQACPA